MRPDFGMMKRKQKEKYRAQDQLRLREEMKKDAKEIISSKLNFVEKMNVMTVLYVRKKKKSSKLIKVTS